MAYSKDYFNLQILFAKKVSEFTNTSLPDCLLIYTGFYKTFKIPGWDYDPQNETWKLYLSKIKGQNIVDETYLFYLSRINGIPEEDPKISKQFGCFSYEYDIEENSVYIHFKNGDASEPGPLSSERKSQRISELKEMFRDVKEKFPEVEYVKGFSWLYNLESYKRLFPISYSQNPKVNTDWFKSGSIWGQFLDSAGELKPEISEQFKKCVSTAEDINELKGCFPYKLLEVVASIEKFYTFYKIE